MLFNYDGNSKRSGIYEIINQLDKKGNLLATFINAREAEKATGVLFSAISQCANNKRRSAGGFIWRFTNEINLPIKEDGRSLKK